MEELKIAFIGIDNGKQGGIVAIDENENILGQDIMPLKSDGEYDIGAIALIIDKYAKQYKCKFALEKAHTMPLNGAKANFTNGYQYGIMQSILILGMLSYEIVSAKHWQKVIFQGQTVKDTKESSINFCLQKWPNNNWKKTERCTKQHDGLTDAGCLALYIKRISKN